jgi:hypothetical protein
MITKEEILRRAGLGNIDTAAHKQAKTAITAFRDMLDTTVAHNRNSTRHVVKIEMQPARTGTNDATKNLQLVADINAWGAEYNIDIIRDSDIDEDIYIRTFTAYRFSSKEDATLFKLTFGGDYIDTLQDR